MTARKEPAKVTIANLEREVRNLTARCVDLVKSRDENYDSAKQWRDQAQKIQSAYDKMKEDYGWLRDAGKYSEGYIARVKECDGKGSDNALG